MKAIIEFELPEDNGQYKIHNMASDMYSFIWDLSQHLRSEQKYNDKLTNEQDIYLEQLREKFYEFLGDYNIDLDL
jgi:hypothetical protein